MPLSSLDEWQDQTNEGDNNNEIQFQPQRSQRHKQFHLHLLSLSDLVYFVFANARPLNFKEAMKE
ncbi:hypothetical protein CR513_28130, partial [Mucuna pruriens]